MIGIFPSLPMGAECPGAEKLEADIPTVIENPRGTPTAEEWETLRRARQQLFKELGMDEMSKSDTEPLPADVVSDFAGDTGLYMPANNNQMTDLGPDDDDTSDIALPLANNELAEDPTLTEEGGSSW